MTLGISRQMRLGLGSGPRLVSVVASVFDSATVHLRGSDWDGTASTVTSGVGSKVFNVTDLTLVDGGFDAAASTTPALISVDTDLLSLASGQNATVGIRYRAVNGSAGERPFAVQNGSAADSGQGMAYRRRSVGGAFDAQFGDGTNGVNTADLTLPLNGPYSSLLFIVDTSTVALNSRGSSASAARPAGDMTPGVAVHLFRRSDAAAGYDKGRISDFVIWDRTLDSAEQAEVVTAWNETP